MKLSKKEYQNIYPKPFIKRTIYSKPFNKRTAFQRQKRGKR